MENKLLKTEILKEKIAKNAVLKKVSTFQGSNKQDLLMKLQRLSINVIIVWLNSGDEKFSNHKYNKSQNKKKKNIIIFKIIDYINTFILE
jgi:hypothetical protein